ncbi:DUF1007 family protein [Enterovirga aerilata]|uniref:DUF1007 family protein n=1 Tax=Enterovirga aerilata TaxID=2730920 RepID=A0A849I5B1_9HYPH|nr:DUF1007 family protein [Enterovirga sp. DB1703]NNM72521.1 DUF1007 family protein [Enterovirga sp. DB1703]
MRFVTHLGAALAVALAASPAVAHPHVWVKSKATILYDANGRITGIRHGWSFDEAYSAYAVQGFPKGPDGRPAPDKMAELAKINIESLAEQGFFTSAKANGQKLGFAEPVNYATSFDGNVLTLTFELPLRSPAKADRAFTLEVYDPTFFVDFAIPEGEDAVRLEGAPKGCALNVTRPKPPEQPQSVSESFFNALSAASQYGAQFASRVLVACP